MLSPLHLGVRAVLAKSFARIHRANLINWGIAPLEFDDPAEHGTASSATTSSASTGCARRSPPGGRSPVTNRRSGRRFRARCVLTPRERDILLAGGLLAQTAARRRDSEIEPSKRGRASTMTQRESARSTCAAAPAAAWSSTSATCRRPAPERDRILLAALGSPDPYGRQLDGLGRRHLVALQGLHHRPAHAIRTPTWTTRSRRSRSRRPVVDYTGNCGNCSSAVGPFAIDERLVSVGADGEAVGAHPQHEHEEDHRGPRAGGGRRGRGGGRLRAARRGRARARASRSTSSTRAARAPAGSCPPAGPTTSIDGRRGLDGRRHQPDGLRARQGPRAHRHRVAAGDGRRPRPGGAPRGHPRGRGRGGDGHPGQRGHPEGGGGGAADVFTGLDGARLRRASRSTWSRAASRWAIPTAPSR